MKTFLKKAMYRVGQVCGVVMCYAIGVGVLRIVDNAITIVSNQIHLARA